MLNFLQKKFSGTANKLGDIGVSEKMCERCHVFCKRNEKKHNSILFKNETNVAFSLCSKPSKKHNNANSLMPQQ